VSNHLTYDSLSREKAGNSEKNVAGSIDRCGVGRTRAALSSPPRRTFEAQPRNLIPGRPNYPKLAKYACPE
jgi:hypothetical protein